MPFLQQTEEASLHHINYIVRTASDPLDLAPVVQETVTAVDPKQAIWGLTTFEPILESAESEMLAGLFIQGLIIGMALLLSAIGIYGVLSYSIGRRTQEMGIRMALGADRKKLLKLIVGEGLSLAVVGLLAGVLLAYAVIRYLQGALFDMEAAGLLEYLLSVPPILIAAVAASYLPARRAARLDPTLALRHE